MGSSGAYVAGAEPTNQRDLAMSEQNTAPEAVAAALAEAMNAHDLDAFVSLFSPDDSRQPFHPDRAFRGRDQVRSNWSTVFSGVPDFRAELVATAVETDTLWSEWRWRGTHADGSRLGMAGVIICGASISHSATRTGHRAVFQVAASGSARRSKERDHP
jgi:ketosteroid isomerase-like protein